MSNRLSLSIVKIFFALTGPGCFEYHTVYANESPSIGPQTPAELAQLSEVLNHIYSPVNYKGLSPELDPSLKPHPIFNESKGSDNALNVQPYFWTDILKESDLDYAKDTIKQNYTISESATPVVFMHGLLDAGIFPGMLGFCQQVRAKYNAHVVCLNVADFIMSAVVKMDNQLAQMQRILEKDEDLNRISEKTGGFYLVGISQGGILTRGWTQRFNKPKVKRLISWTGVQNGIAYCPGGFNHRLCDWWNEGKLGPLGAPYNSPLAFSDYWRDPLDHKRYLQQSRFLSDLNNERRINCFHSKEPEIDCKVDDSDSHSTTIKSTRIINEKYRTNMKNLEYYINIEANYDSMIYPHISESHGEYEWGRSDPDMQDNKHTIPLQSTPEYSKDVDAIGLYSLDRENKIKHWSYNGQHVQIPEKMWTDMVLPVLGGGKPMESGEYDDGAIRMESGEYDSGDGAIRMESGVQNYGDSSNTDLTVTRTVENLYI